MQEMLLIYAIKAKKFLKGDWLKRVVFEPNLKYLHVGISFLWQPIRSCFDFQTRWRRDSRTQRKS